MARCEYNMAASAILNQLSFSKYQDGCTKTELLLDFLLYSAKVLFGYANKLFQYLNGKCVVIVTVVVLVLVLYLLYKCYWKPLLYTKEITDIGYDHIPRGKDRQTRITRAQQARRLGTKIPPPYPNGWFAVVESEDLKIGGVVSVDALGQNLCVYRGEDGVARCVDAYCPHLGANLAVGGAVRGGCIECPFHKWRFAEDGVCVSVPGSEQAPKGVSIKTWTAAEADGAVWIWHDAEARPPLWPMTDTPEAVKWGYRGRNEFVVSAHIQEIPENGADVAHLNAVHSPSLLSTLGEKYPFLQNIIVVSGHEAACNISIQCTPSLGEASQCVEGVCACLEDFHFRDGSCWPRTGLFENCARSSECYLKDASHAVECRNSLCQCSFQFPFDQDTGTCSNIRVGSSAVNLSGSFMMAAVAILFLFFS